jgi:hypothetical protein
MATLDYGWSVRLRRGLGSLIPSAAVAVALSGVAPASAAVTRIDFNRVDYLSTQNP